MELELQKGREELAREEQEETEKAPKERGGRREVPVAVKIVRRSEENVAKPVKRDRKDRNRRIRDQNVTLKPVVREALEHRTTARTANTPPPRANAYTST